MKKRISKKHILTFVECYKKCNGDYDYKYLDEPLYWFCKKAETRPHKDPSVVYGKVALINRVYRTSIEKVKGGGGEWKLANRLVEKNIFSKTVIEPLQRIKAFNRNTCEDIIELHKKFVELADGATKRKDTSFCSKYLHFHFPKIIPIFDSNAYDTLWEIFGYDIDEIIKKTSHYDENFTYNFSYICYAYLELITALAGDGIKDPNLRIIDVVLYDKLYNKIWS